MLLDSIIPQLPATTAELLIYIVAWLGAILLPYSIFVEAEHRRDLIRIVAGAGLFVYAWYIGNLIFMIVAGGIFLASLVEFIEIYLGLHHHSRENLEQYKKYAFMNKKKE